MEFSPKLCRVAEANVDDYRKRTGSDARIQIIESDVVLHEFTDEAVLYLFNPFDGYILAAVLENLMRSLRPNPRRAWIIYRNPVHREVIESVDGIELLKEYRSWGSDFAVYTTGSGNTCERGRGE